MTFRRRLVDWSLAGLLILVPAMVLRSSLKTGNHTVLDDAILRVSAPLESAVSWLVEGVGGIWSRYVGLVGVESENRELRADNERLRKELAAAQRRAVDTDALADLLELKRRSPADAIAARVIAASTTPQFRTIRIRIDRGQGEVAAGMPVITSAGLVGKILDAYGDHADVMLINDPDSKVNVVIPSAGRGGTLIGEGADNGYHGKIELERPLDASGKGVVREGDLVVTSGAGGAFPAGIVVGTVASVTVKSYRMVQEIEVEPAVDLGALRAVMVLLAAPPAPDPDAEHKRKSEPAFGTRPL
ncbi:MAG: rod shape-determining protein MreC [Deltaproteobacteria bacterium]|nr:rod shape-determining protein MreC [Deltaproteobacteria bacterium]